MARIPPAGAHALGGLHPGFIFQRRKILEGVHGVFQRVDGLHLGKAALEVALVLEFGIGLLDEAGVGQHDGAEIDGGRGAMDFFGEAVFHKFWNEPVWSMWAWVSSMASRLAGSNGKLRLLSSARFLNPGNCRNQ